MKGIDHMKRTSRVCAGFAAALALGVSACSGPAATQPSGEAESGVLPASAVPGAVENRFYDPEASGDLLQVSWVQYDEFDDFAREVDLVLDRKSVV